MFECMECGRLFRSTAAAELAMEEGCPRCGGSDIDLPRFKERTNNAMGYKPCASARSGLACSCASHYVAVRS